jgi:histidine triad (HIT) family protein
LSTRPDCIFCKIVRGEAPSHRVCEDERTIAFMDIFPVTDGHTLVVTKDHFENLFEADEDALAAIARTSHRVAAAIRSELAPDGLMVFQLNGRAAGQTVFHYHMHLMPRATGEPLALASRVPGAPARLAEIAAKLARALARVSAVLIATVSLTACAAWREQRSQRAEWTSEWNGRIDDAKSDWQHPCATRPFVSWADAFLEGCQELPRSGECRTRIEWVDERVEQCRAWTAWQLRNFNQHERVEGTPPSMRIE